MSGTLPAYIWQDDIYRGFYLPNHSLVSICGVGCYHANRLRIDLFSLTPVSFKNSGDVVRLIQRSLCPLPDLLSELQDAINFLL